MDGSPNKGEEGIIPRKGSTITLIYSVVGSDFFEGKTRDFTGGIKSVQI